MTIDTTLLNSLTSQAKSSPRLRVAYDLRTHSTSSGQAKPEDNSQRILNRIGKRMQRSSLLEAMLSRDEVNEVNAMEPGTVLPIHRHRGSKETVVILRGRLRQNFYDESGHLEESIIVAPGTDGIGFSVELGRWHNTECLESGTVILECKDGRYEPLGKEDVMKI